MEGAYGIGVHTGRGCQGYIGQRVHKHPGCVGGEAMLRQVGGCGMLENRHGLQDLLN